MTLVEKVDEVFEELERYAVQRNAPGPLFSRAGLWLIALTVVAVLLIWAGLLLDVAWAAWGGVIGLVAVIFFEGYSLYKETKNPGVIYAKWARVSAANHTNTLTKLHALDPIALAEAEAVLAQRIAAVEAATLFLAGPLRTLGLVGSLSAFLALGTALEKWTDLLNGNRLFILAYSAFVFGLLLGAERAETGLVQLRLNRELTARALVLQQTGQPLS